MRGRGFTLIELLVVLGLVGVLAAIAIPAYSDYVLRGRVSEGFVIATPIREQIEDYYAFHGRFPADNRALAMHEPEALYTRAVEAVEVRDGAIHVRYRRAVMGQRKTGNVLSIVPAVKQDNPTAPVIWTCGSGDAPDGYRSVGERLTDLALPVRPGTCRD